MVFFFSQRFTTVDEMDHQDWSDLGKKLFRRSFDRRPVSSNRKDMCFNYDDDLLTTGSRGYKVSREIIAEITDGE